MSNHNQQNYMAIFGLLFGAVCWGVIWYPYRLMAESGVGGIASSAYSYTIAICIGSILFITYRRNISQLSLSACCLSVVAGWTNLSYVLAVIDGEVMRVMLLFYLSPLWTLILAHYWLKEPIHRTGVYTIIIAFVGALLMLHNVHQPASLPLPRNTAEWLALSSGIGFSLTNVMTRRFTHLSVPAKSMLVWVGVAAMAFLLMPWLNPQPTLIPSLSVSQWRLLGFIAVLLVAATVFVQYGVTKISAIRASVLFLFELVVAAVASYYLADEVMTWNEWVGGLLIVVAGLTSAMQPHQVTQASLKRAGTFCGKSDFER